MSRLKIEPKDIVRVSMDGNEPPSPEELEELRLGQVGEVWASMGQNTLESQETTHGERVRN